MDRIRRPRHRILEQHKPGGQAYHWHAVHDVQRQWLALRTTVDSLAGLVEESSLLGLSGSDLEAILVRSILEAEASERSEVTEADLRRAFGDFLPATSARERELQILCGVLECTSKELLPAKYRDADRGRLAARIAELKLELRG